MPIRTWWRPPGASSTVPEAEPGATLARYYDLDLAEDPGDLDLYLALAAQVEGAILELAAGTGRVAVPLAAAGHQVTAVDNDPAMLARAAEHWQTTGAGAGVTGPGDLRLVEADLLEVHLEPAFGAAILALNSLFLLADERRQAAALAALARHLRPGGLAVVDVWLPDTDDLARYDGRLSLEWERDDPTTGERVAKLASALHDPATGRVELRTYFEAWPAAGGPVRRTARLDVLRLVGAAELVQMARAAELVVERLAGDYELTPFGPGAGRAVLLARKPAEGLV
jgi:SAM-dependent methyltransferase